MKNRRKRIPAAVVICAAVLVVLAAGALLFLGRRRGKAEGVVLEPLSQYSADSVPCYRQKDPVWAKDKLGDSSYTMSGSGCLTSCIAAALTTQLRAEDPSAEALTPGELNRLFSEAGVYNASGDIVWGKIREALPDTEVLVASGVDSREIDQALSEGKYPAVRVRVHGSGAWHWVLLAGTDENGYLCMDPLNGDETLVPLSEHGGVVYSMRTVSWKGQGGF